MGSQCVNTAVGKSREAHLFSSSETEPRVGCLEMTMSEWEGDNQNENDIQLLQSSRAREGEKAMGVGALSFGGP